MTDNVVFVQFTKNKYERRVCEECGRAIAKNTEYGYIVRVGNNNCLSIACLVCASGNKTRAQ